MSGVSIDGRTEDMADVLGSQRVIALIYIYNLLCEKCSINILQGKLGR